MTAAEEVTALRREVDRLRRELEEAFEMARGIGEERNELARQLGAEVAETQRLRKAMLMAADRVIELANEPGRE